MASQNLDGQTDFWLPDKRSHVDQGIFATANDSVIDAADEYVHWTGHLWLPARSGSKTISAAGGGKIHWMVGAATITFANASTNLRVGIQDVSATGGPARGDGTFDVYADLVGGTDTITAATFRTDAMESGTKTLTHGDHFAIVIGMTARGGTDLVRVKGVASLGLNSPQTVLQTSGPAYAAVSNTCICAIEFDDGTFGFFDGGWVTSTGIGFAALSWHLDSTPDEYANIFQVPFPCSIDAVTACVTATNTDSDYEIILYSDPLGTPTVIETITVDAAHHIAYGAYRIYQRPLATVRTLLANTDYAIALRPTSGNPNNIGVGYHDVADVAHWDAHSLGDKCYIGSRSGQTGAFSTTTTRRIHSLGVRVCALDDGAGGSGGGGPIIGPGKIVRNS